MLDTPRIKMRKNAKKIKYLKVEYGLYNNCTLEKWHYSNTSDGPVPVLSSSVH